LVAKKFLQIEKLNWIETMDQTWIIIKQSQIKVKILDCADTSRWLFRLFWNWNLVWSFLPDLRMCRNSGGKKVFKMQVSHVFKMGEGLVL
jgi:hypothetical protein